MFYHLGIISFVLGQIIHAVSICQARTIIVDVTETVVITSTSSNVLTALSSSLTTLSSSRTTQSSSSTTSQNPLGSCPQGTLVSNIYFTFVTSTKYYLGSATHYITQNCGILAPALLRRAVATQYGNSSTASILSSESYSTSTVTVVESYPALLSSCKRNAFFRIHLRWWCDNSTTAA